jgi:hypothetical protein
VAGAPSAAAKPWLTARAARSGVARVLAFHQPVELGVLERRGIGGRPRWFARRLRGPRCLRRGRRLHGLSVRHGSPRGSLARPCPDAQAPDRARRALDHRADTPPSTQGSRTGSHADSDSPSTLPAATRRPDLAAKERVHERGLERCLVRRCTVHPLRRSGSRRGIAVRRGGLAFGVVVGHRMSVVSRHGDWGQGSDVRTASNSVAALEPAPALDLWVGKTFA